ncbi:MAG: RNA polymerase sigma factor RpoD/SigA [Candidatus Poribacteria bacterium]
MSESQNFSNRKAGVDYSLWKNSFSEADNEDLTVEDKYFSSEDELEPSESEDDVDFNPFDNAIGRYLQKIGRVSLLTPQEEQELFQEFQTGKKQIRRSLDDLPDKKILREAGRNAIEPGKSRRRRTLDEEGHPILQALTSTELERLVTEVKKIISSFSATSQKPPRTKVNLALSRRLSKVDLERILEDLNIGLERMQSSRQRIVESNLLLVASVAKQYAFKNISLSFMDLMQEGSIGLMTAVEKFKIEKGYKFSTYAIWWIMQAIRRAMDEQSRTVRVPCYITESKRRIRQTASNLAQRLDRQPELVELAKEVGLSSDKVWEVLQSTQDIISLDMSLDETPGERTLADLMPNEEASSPEREVLKTTRKEAIEQVLDTLLPREKKVIKLRFGLFDGNPCTLAQIGKELGVSRERVRQIESDALRKLRHPSRRRQLRELFDD